jgi:SAM-dependent methyltransferase
MTTKLDLQLQKRTMSKKLASNPFHLYNDYYDLLYQDKDYAKEAGYITNIIKQYNPSTKDIIELGSGTGNYSSHLCNNGFKITGIEQSWHMHEISKAKNINGFHPIVDDIAHFDINKTFGAAVSLFHVISYLTENEQMISCFKRVANHLNSKGIFVFDVWYTPAVYSLAPQPRVKKVENELFELTRHADPLVDYQKNIVQVNYEMIIRNKETEEFELLKEVHSMRHFSTPEIELFADLSGLKVIGSEEFLTAKEPSSNTWGVCYILQKHD